MLTNLQINESHKTIQCVDLCIENWIFCHRIMNLKMYSSISSYIVVWDSFYIYFTVLVKNEFENSCNVA